MWILLDKNGNSCLGDMGIVSACKNAGDATEYETDGYRWLAPEVSPLCLLVPFITVLTFISTQIVIMCILFLHSLTSL